MGIIGVLLQQGKFLFILLTRLEKGLTVSFEEYNRLLEKQNVIPNWNVSEEFFWTLGWKIIKENGRLSVRNAQNELMLPRVGDTGVEREPRETVYSDFPSSGGVNKRHTLGYNYIYDPKSFLDLGGKEKKSFRKNVESFEKESSSIVYAQLTSKDTFSGLEKDPQILQYFDCIGPNQCFGLWVDKILIGANLWDENYKYTNFRFSIIPRRGRFSRFRFAKDYLRLQFFTKNAISIGKLVNDGGDDDSVKLRRYKMKLGPVERHIIYSWS